MRKMIENMSFKRIKHSIVWRVSKWKWALLHKLLFRLVPICQNKVCVISWGGKYLIAILKLLQLILPVTIATIYML